VSWPSQKCLMALVRDWSGKTDGWGERSGLRNRGPMAPTCGLDFMYLIIFDIELSISTMTEFRKSKYSPFDR